MAMVDADWSVDRATKVIAYIGDDHTLSGGSPSYATVIQFHRWIQEFADQEAFDAGGVDTIWVVMNIDRDGCYSAYSRVTPGHHAGTVQVQCQDRPEGGCVVSVTYDMSLLPGADPTGLNAYDNESFTAMLSEWATEVSQTIGL